MNGYNPKHPRKSPRDKGFACGLWSKPIDSYPESYTALEVAQYRAGWYDGNYEATIRRQEARAGLPRTVVITERNGKVTLYTEAAAGRRAARMKGGD